MPSQDLSAELGDGSGGRIPCQGNSVPFHDVVGPIPALIPISSGITGATVLHDIDVSAEPNGGRLDQVPRKMGRKQTSIPCHMDNIPRRVSRSLGVVERENFVA